jgi:hypothetical protein
MNERGKPFLYAVDQLVAARDAVPRLSGVSSGSPDASPWDRGVRIGSDDLKVVGAELGHRAAQEQHAVAMTEVKLCTARCRAQLYQWVEVLVEGDRATSSDGSKSVMMSLPVLLSRGRSRRRRHRSRS